MRVLRFPKTTLAVAALVCSLIDALAAARLGGEFMPPLDEGDLLYMPSALPGHLGRQGVASCCSRPTG